MRKTIVMLIVILFVVAGLSTAEEVGYSSMSTDDLLRIRDEIEYELMLREEADWKVLYMNEPYIGGENISNGRYCIKVKDVSTNYHIMSSVSPTSDTKQYGILIRGSDVVNRIWIENGNLLTVTQDIYIKPAPEPPSLFMD